MIEFENVLLYQFGFYAPNTRIEPSPKIIGDLMGAFKGTEFMPTTVQEMRLGPVSETRQQLHLVTKDSDWRIEFEPHRLTFTRKRKNGINIDSPKKFIKDVSDFCSRLSPIISLSGTRLSFVTKELLSEMKDNKLTKINSKLLTLPEFYVENPPTEWTTRNVTKYMSGFGNPSEIFNVITDINRVQGNIVEKRVNKRFDRIEIGFDINTHQDNTKQRFQYDDAESFLKEATALSRRLRKEIGETIL